MSTPAGRRGFFFDAWEHGDGWRRTQITAQQFSRIDPLWLADERRDMGELMFRQEYICEFIDDSEAVIPSYLVERALNDEL